MDLTPTGRAVVVLASLALGAAWTTGSEPARLGACLLLAPLLVDWVAKIGRLDGIEVRTGRRRTRVGAGLVEKVRVGNRRRRGVFDLHVAAQGILATSRGQAGLVEHLPAGGDVEVDLQVRPRARGHATLRVFAAWTRHPLGLVRLLRRIEVAATVIVEPARIPLDVPADATGSDGDRTAESVHPRAGDAYYALRELRDGDDWAHVHALRSATLGQPVHVLRRGALARSARILLDLRSPPGRAPARFAGQAFEWGLSAAASLVEILVRSGRTVDVVALGRKRATFLDLGGRAPLTEFLDHLAGARPQGYASAPETTLAWLAAGEGDAYWIVAGGYAAAIERERTGRRLRVLEWSG